MMTVERWRLCTWTVGLHQNHLPPRCKIMKLNLDSFGFLVDGISEPAVKSFDKPEPVYPVPVYPGIIVTGYEGDPYLDKREPWAFDGSFFVFCWLFQLVPEFDKFLKDGEGNVLTLEERSELLGARMVGRWKSGAFILLSSPDLLERRLKISKVS